MSPARLTVIGAEREDVLRYLADPETMRWIDVRGRVSGERLWEALHEADVLCAPSLSGESFGMVLTEAFAAGTPAIASAIAGYSDVVSDGVDGVLVPPGDPQRLAEELQRAHHEPERLRAMGEAARAERRSATPGRGSPTGSPRSTSGRSRRPSRRAPYSARPTGRECGRPTDGRLAGAQRLPSLDPPLAKRGSRRRRAARRAGLGVAGALGVGLTALAAQKIGVDNVRRQHRPLRRHLGAGGLRLMALSLFFRAASWYWIARRGAAQPARSAAATSPRRR